MDYRGFNKYQGAGVVEIGGKRRPIKGGTNATGILCTLRNCSIVEARQIMEEEEKWNGTEHRDMIYALLCAGCHTTRQEIDFNEFDVGDWMDERPEVLIEILTILGRENGKKETKKKAQRT